jgi:hypothetical protein
MNPSRRVPLFPGLALIGLAFASPAFAQTSEADVPGETVEQHLQQALEYLEAGDYEGANLEFETVFRLEDLPQDIHQKADIYAKAAQEYLSGERTLFSGYAMGGLGYYRENSTSAGSGQADDLFVNPRVGARVNHLFSEQRSFNGSLDYRFRWYDADRRNDSDLRWNGEISKTLDQSNWAYGVRGRVSYRGDGNYRNDYGAFTTWRTLSDADNQFELGGEFRRRAYPSGSLRARTRNIAELTAAWTRSLRDGKASFTLSAQGGREFASGRVDGDSNFFGLSPTFDFTINDRWSGFVFAWWQNDRYSFERVKSDEADDIVVLPTRNDNLYELGGGLTWEFAENWSFNPEVLYIRDQSNLLGANYSSTEVWFTIRRDF